MFQFDDDFVIRMQYYAISQLRQNPDYRNLCEMVGNSLNDIKKVSEYILDCIDIDTATGVWLDYLGWLVGTSRDFFDISRYFCVNSLDVNVSKYIWFSGNLIDVDSLEDEVFRKRIYAKIGYNTSNGTRNENISIIKNMINAVHVKLKKVAPMQLDVTVVGNNLVIPQSILDDINSILGMGVGIRDFTILGEQ